MVRLPYKMRRVVRKFTGPLPGRTANVPREELECGHIITDKDWVYGNETAVQIGAVNKAMTGSLGKRRCHACARGVA